MRPRLLALLAILAILPPASAIAETEILTYAEAKQAVAEDGYGRQAVIWVGSEAEAAKARAFARKLDDEGYNGNPIAIADVRKATLTDRQDFGLDVKATPLVAVLRKGYRLSETEKRTDVVSFGSFPMAEATTAVEFATKLAACKYDKASGSYYCSSGQCYGRKRLFSGRFRRRK